MNLSDLRPAPGSTQKRKRLGRGTGSGLGKTSGKGHKGKSARSGGNTPPGYEGGQMPLQRRLPKRGFTNRSREEYNVINIGRLDQVFDSGAVVDLAALIDLGLVRRKGLPVKILGDGAVTKPLTVRVQGFSAGAKQQIEAAGGSAEVVARA